MSSKPESAPATLLDSISILLERPARPLDFALSMRLDDRSIDHAGLRRGAKSACRQFFTAGCLWRRGRWVRAEALEPRIEEATGDAREAMERFMAQPMDLRRELPIRQLGMSTSAGLKLLTRIHHAAGDLMSLAQWLDHQLRVAAGDRAPVLSPQPHAPPALRSAERSVLRSRYAFAAPAALLWRRSERASPARHWRSLAIEAAPLRALAAEVGGISYNDVLAAAVLEACEAWNRGHGLASNPGLGVWMPINIRERVFAGFGNGTSRVRVYRRWERDADRVARARSVREQLNWTRDHGEWAVPEDGAIARMPYALRAPLLRTYLSRPGIDYGSVYFSHAERLGEPGQELLAPARDLEVVGELYSPYPCALTAITREGVTRFTCTWDPLQWTEKDAASFLRLVEAATRCEAEVS